MRRTIVWMLAMAMFLAPSAWAQEEEPVPFTRQMRERLNILFQTIERGGPRDQDRAVAELVRMGAPTQPYLVEGLRSSNGRLQQAAAECLGWLGETSVVPELQRAALEAEGRGESGEALRLEAAVALCRLGSGAGIEHLIELLGSEEPVVRLRALSQLRRFTGQRFGYRFDGDEASRKETHRQWRIWWDQARAGFAVHSRAGVKPADPSSAGPVRRGRPGAQGPAEQEP